MLYRRVDSGQSYAIGAKYRAFGFCFEKSILRAIPITYLSDRSPSLTNFHADVLAWRYAPLSIAFLIP